MITYSTFHNTDPPVLTELWRSRAGETGYVQPASCDLFEQLVFSRLYFDYHGLVIAREDGRALGFAHAGFGSNEARNGLSTDDGAICLLLTRPEAAAEAAEGLLLQCEQYLARRGAKRIFGGCLAPLCPFYLGLFNASLTPGVLDADEVVKQLYLGRGYEEIHRLSLMRRDLCGFEAPIDRNQMAIRRGMIVEVTVDAPTRNWWEACTLGEFDLTRFEVVPRGGGSPAAWAVFRNMEPSGSASVVRSIGLVELQVAESFRGRGVAIFLLSEAFRRFLRDGITLVEAQVMNGNAAAAALLRKLGFHETGQGGVFRKDCPNAPSVIA
jgi:GNAT superfamily N-acetyltransferase